MGQIDITPAQNPVVAPGQLRLHISAPGHPWAGLPVTFGDVSHLKPPTMAASWCSVHGFPLPVIVNTDGSGNADVVLDLQPPVGTDVGTYSAAFTAGYGTDVTSCQPISAKVEQLAAPGLKGLSLVDAEQAIAAAHLQLGNIVGVQGDDSRVVGQQPAAGTIVDAGSQIVIEMAPPATLVSQVHFVNCTIFDYDIWVNDRTLATWSKWQDSPLPKNPGTDCPPPGGSVATVDLTDGHYYDLQAAWAGFDFHPNDGGNWRLPHGALVGGNGAPIMYVTLT